MNVDLICLIDESGSMEAIKTDVIGGFNRFLDEQKAKPGNARFTLIKFNIPWTPIYTRVPIREVPHLDHVRYKPGNMTALLDAIGKTVWHVRTATAGDVFKADKTIFCVITDGQENSSREYRREQIRNLLDECQRELAWEIVYLGANQDAFAEAGAFGVPWSNIATATAGPQGMRAAFATASNYTTNSRGYSGNYGATLARNSTQAVYDANLTQEEQDDKAKGEAKNTAKT